MGVDPYLHNLDRKPSGRRRAKPAPVALSLFDAVYDATPTTNEALTDPELVVAPDRVEEVHKSLASSARHWIDLGKPVAVAVGKAHGKVTAEMFRAEAEKLGKLPSETEQRTLSYIAVMFRELCKEGHLQARRRSDNSVVKEYSKVQANHQVVYEPVRGR